MEVGRKMIDHGLVQPRTPLNAHLMVTGFGIGLFVAILLLIFAGRAIVRLIFSLGGGGSEKLAKASNKGRKLDSLMGCVTEHKNE